MLAKPPEEPIMRKSVEKVAKSGEMWGEMWKTLDGQPTTDDYKRDAVSSTE
jgi:hypothetical protein